MDLISANQNDNSISVMINDDSGGFAFSSAPGVGSYPDSVTPPVINPQSVKILGNGALQFGFSNTNNIVFSVQAATNRSLPASDWTVLGSAVNVGGGLYQFTDAQATNFPGRFYLLRFP